MILLLQLWSLNSEEGGDVELVCERNETNFAGNLATWCILSLGRDC
jgi:hypothetical protein